MSTNPPDSARKVFLFSGHMIDAPGRELPRFPADTEPIARRAIMKLLYKLDAGPRDLAICGGACGGDLLFAESAMARAVPLELYLPFTEETFLLKSVDFANADWHERFVAATRAAVAVHIMPRERGPIGEGDDPYEQNNLWMLEAASRYGAERVEFICLWNGRGGDGPGGSQHLMNHIRELQGCVHWLNTTQLWG